MPLRERERIYVMPKTFTMCNCGRNEINFPQNRCKQCIEEDFVAHAEAFRTAVSQGNLQESAT